MKPRSLRKAAILIASLDPQHADALLGHMSAAQAKLLRETVERLGDVDGDEQGEVIEEFFRVGPLVPDEDPAGIELDAALAASLTGGLTGHPAPPDAAPAKSSFECLRDAAPQKLAAFLRQEHPQTVAVVISRLPADRAAAVLVSLPVELESEVARRLAELEDSDAEALSEIERALASWLDAQSRSEQRRSAGVATLSGILGAADPQARHRMLSNLARHDRELADKLESPVGPALSFADVERMDTASLAVVLRHAELELLTLALAGASPQFAERTLAALGAEAAGAVREALCHLGPTRLSDLEEAQSQLAALARELERRGEIAPEIHGRLSFAV